jgi:hypothetical protein
LPNALLDGLSHSKPEFVITRANEVAHG